MLRPAEYNAMPVMTIDYNRTLNLLSSMYLCKPTKDVIEGWRAALDDDTSNIVSSLKKALGDIDAASEQEQEDLLWEFTRLFIGPYKLPCPPWESVYTSPKRLMMQDAYENVVQLFHREGLALGSPDFMADHIGVEINFLALLLRRADGEPERRAHYSGAAKTFAEEHLQTWVPAFTRDLEEAATYPFYKELARATRELIAAVHDDVLACRSSEGA
jgi:TorA maturation chaperone TorD